MEREILQKVRVGIYLLFLTSVKLTYPNKNEEFLLNLICVTRFL